MSRACAQCLLVLLIGFGLQIVGYTTLGLLGVGLAFLLLLGSGLLRGETPPPEGGEESQAERETRERYRRAEAEAQDAVYYEAEYRDVSDPRKGEW